MKKNEKTHTYTINCLFMIKATELRLGNWVSNGENNYTVDIGMLWDAATLEYYELFGIPLTPEILEKCGFVKEKRGKLSDFDGEEFVYFKNGVDLFDNSENGSGYDYATYTRYPGKGFKAGVTIKYLHQLQNLYLALTGEELEIKINQ